ncbi:MAG: long-chain fatty acid--CoA ligase [Gammaproteobacteria bacterium]|nr:MAG: long-chain fatty acid--CoA ligase [Pseudomonadota bacterium]PIE38549.1 MAG: long-chain fatty acid--CoA ligase [Gammaproteobacteria bacterium]
MIGNMMNSPLLVSDIIKSSAERYPEQSIVSRVGEHTIHRYSYQDAYKRTCKLANALADLGVSTGDRVATLAWNNYRHLELYYAIGGSGAVVHTLNARLFTEQIAWIANHAEDKLIFVDPDLVHLLEEVKDELTTVEAIIINCNEDEMPDTSLPHVLNYETLIKNQPDTFAWPTLDENTACGLCYTSGTTGNPKGVLYSNRSTVLHAMMSGSSQYLKLDEASSVMPVVPMYHVCAWGIPYSGLLYGSKLVFPGPRLDGEALQELIGQERVDKAYGVPTVWLNLHNYLQESGKKIPSLKTVGVGGSASPVALVETWAKTYGVYWMGIWGMTETSPLATAAIETDAIKALPKEQRFKIQASAGKPMFGIEIEIFDTDNKPVAHDGVTTGTLKARGPWVLSGYFKGEGADKFEDGWFNTGDVAVINPEGYLKIVDRSKDVIKSGGEWISSVDLENAALHDPTVNEACVIGVAHPKWDERPVMLVTLRDERRFSEEALMNILKEKVAKWWLPDKVIVVDSLPHTGTGKLRKVDLRHDYADILQ